MVEWWGSGGDLGGGSFRALSSTTCNSTSNYFTDSGNYLRSNDDRVTGGSIRCSATVASNPAANTT